MVTDQRRAGRRLRASPLQARGRAGLTRPRPHPVRCLCRSWTPSSATTACRLRACPCSSSPSAVPSTSRSSVSPAGRWGSERLLWTVLDGQDRGLLAFSERPSETQHPGDALWRGIQ